MSENLTPGTFTPADYTPDKNAIKPLEPFRFWCQHVLPLVYDDSLSYYELLCKVVDYLNKTMEDVDLLSQDVTNMFTAYGELQTFVNTNIKENMTAPAIHRAYNFHLLSSMGTITVRSSMFSFFSSIVFSIGRKTVNSKWLNSKCHYLLNALMSTAPTVESVLTPARIMDVF